MRTRQDLTIRREVAPAGDAGREAPALPERRRGTRTAGGLWAAVVRYLGFYAGVRPAGAAPLDGALAQPCLGREPAAEGTFGRGAATLGAVGRRLAQRDAPALELVVAHLNVSRGLQWLDDVPAAWQVTVYGSFEQGGRWPARHVGRLELGEVADLSGVVGRHLSDFYGYLAEYTAFVPDDALFHSPWLLERLAQPDGLQPLQTLSIRSNDRQPPAVFLRGFEERQAFRAERRSTRTLESVFFRDGVHETAVSYRRYYQLQDGDNLVSHFLGHVGLPQWGSASVDVFTASHAGMFGVRQDIVLRHPRRVYLNLLLRAEESYVASAVGELGLLTLFGGFEYYDGAQPRRHIRPREAAAVAGREGAEALGRGEGTDDAAARQDVPADEDKGAA